MSVRLAVDASVLLQPHAGIGIYLREIISRLPNLAPDLSLDLFLGHRWGCIDDIRHLIDCSVGSPSPRENRWRTALKQVPGARQAWHAFKRHRFEKGMAERQFDVFWEPCFVSPGWVDPAVITVHDLSHIRFPQFHPKNRLKWLDNLPRGIERARTIITVSEFTKREIIEVFGCAAERINVIPNGVSSNLQPAAPDKIAAVSEKYGLQPGRYFLSVCTLEPRKNLAILIQAYSRLPQSVQSTTPLVLAGLGGWGREGRRTYLESLCPGCRLVFPGYVVSEDLPGLYSGATAFAYPTVYEGFGIPAIEAMACGAVTLLSDADALIEVAGGQAHHAPAQDVDAWTEALAWASSLSLDERTSIAKAARRQSARYSWDDTACRTLEVLRNTADGKLLSS